MPFDFKALLTAPLDHDLQMEKEDLAWQVYGRAVYNRMTSDRYLAAVNTACMAAGASAQPIHYIAACVRAYLVTGTIAR